MKKLVWISLPLFFLGACGPVATTSNGGNTVVTTTGNSNAGTGTVSEPPIGNQDYMATRWEVFEKHPMAASLLSADELKKQKKYTKLSEALVDPSKVYRLEIRERDEGFDFRKLSERIGELYNLQELSISGIYSELPKEIGRLTQLQSVELSLGMLSKDLPGEIANWKNIKSFTLRKISSNGAADQTDFANIGWLHNLEELTLDGEGLARFPSGLQRLKGLKKLTIQFSPIASLPTDIAQIPNLEYLKLAGLKELKAIPSVGSKLKRLEIRNLDKLTDVSKTFEAATSLDKLEMLSCNTLIVFPVNFNQLSSLRYLYLSDIPMLVNLPSFKNLNKLAEVRLYNLPSFKVFGEDFYEAQFMQKLTVNNCPNLTALPAFERLPLLFSIDLAEVKGDDIKPANYSEGKKIVNGINYYTYVRQLNLQAIFAKSEDLFYRYVNSVDVYDVEAPLALRTKNKTQVQKIYMDLSANSDTNRMVLEQMNQFTSLKKLEINWNEKSQFPKVSVAKTIPKLRLTSLTIFSSGGNKVDWKAAQEFVNQFSDVRELETEGLGAVFYEGQFTGLKNCTRMDLSGIGQSQLAKSVSGLLGGCPKLSELKLNVVTDHIPDEIYKLTQLKSLDVLVWEPRKGTHIVVPAAIGNLKQLEVLKLYVNDGKIGVSSSVDPAINTLSKLHTLELTFGYNVYNSKAFVYPDGIQNLKSLKTLLLSPVKAEPAGLTNMKLDSKKVTLGK